MKKLLLICLLSLFTAFTKAADSTYSITGNFSKIKSGLLYLYVYADGNMKKDSTRIKNGKFSFKGFVQSPSMAILDLKDDKQDYLRFFVEPTNITITGTGDSLALLNVSGSPVNDDDKVLKQRLDYITKWQDKDSKIYEEASKAKNKAVLDSLDEVDNEILKETRKVVSAYVKEHPHSMRSALAITENYGYYAEADEV